MKKMKGFRKVLALVLALMMVFSAVAALAEGEEPEEVQDPEVVDGGGAPENTEVTENPEQLQEGEADETKAFALRGASNSGETNTTENNLETIGPVTIESDHGSRPNDVYWNDVGQNVTGTSYEIIIDKNIADKDDDNGGTLDITVGVDAEIDVKVTVKGNITSEKGPLGVSVDSTATSSSHKAELIVEGSIEAKKGDGIIASAEGNNQVTIQANDVKAGEYGIETDVYLGGSSEITAGNVTVSGTKSVYGISVNQDSTRQTSGTTIVNADSVSASTEGDKKDVYGLDVKNGTVTIGENDNATGGVTAKGDLAYAIIADGNANVTVSKGDVTAEGDYADGIKGTASDGKKAMVSILEGDVTANDNGIWVVANNGGQYTVKATGKDGGKVNAGQAGIDAYADGAGSKTTVNVNSVTQTGNNGYGINTLVGNGGEVLITVNGDITSEKSTGVSASITGDGNVFSAVTISADGMISGKTAGMKIGATGTKGGNVNVFSDISSENGVGLKLFDNGQGAKTSVLIDGTVSGNNAIIVDNDDAAKNIDLTVWKAESTGEEKPLVAGGDYVQDDATVSKFTAAINYIVKLADGLNNDQVVTDKGKTITINEGQENEKTWQTAKENEIVTLTLTDEQLADYNPEKNELEVLYNADDATSKMALGTSAGNGVFTFVNKVITLVMQSGGGMKLGFSFKAKTPEVQPEVNQPEVKPDEKPEEKPEVKPAEEKVESKQEAKTDEPKQEATQTVADTTSTIATTGTATVYNLLKIKDKSGKAELAFRNVGKYEIKSPDGNDEGTFGMEDGKIVLTSQNGKKMNIGQDGKLEYVIGNTSYEFKFGAADLEKLAAVKK